MPKKPEKKSETIEVRVSHSEKLAFMDACKEKGITASQSIRAYIADALNPAPQYNKKRLMLGAIALGFGVAVTLFNLYVFNNKNIYSSNTALVMTYFDKDKDGYITAADVAQMADTEKSTVNWLIASSDANKDGRMSAAEFSNYSKVLIELQSNHSGSTSPETSEGTKKVIVIPSTLSEEERQKLLDQYAGYNHLKKEDLDRLTKLIEALTVANQD